MEDAVPSSQSAVSRTEDKVPFLAAEGSGPKVFTPQELLAESSKAFRGVGVVALGGPAAARDKGELAMAWRDGLGHHSPIVLSVRGYLLTGVRCWPNPPHAVGTGVVPIYLEFSGPDMRLARKAIDAATVAAALGAAHRIWAQQDLPADAKEVEAKFFKSCAVAPTQIGRALRLRKSIWIDIGPDARCMVKRPRKDGAEGHDLCPATLKEMRTPGWFKFHLVLSAVKISKGQDGRTTVSPEIHVSTIAHEVDPDDEEPGANPSPSLGQAEPSTRCAKALPFVLVLVACLCILGLAVYTYCKGRLVLIADAVSVASAPNPSVAAYCDASHDLWSGSTQLRTEDFVDPRRASLVLRLARAVSDEPLDEVRHLQLLRFAEVLDTIGPLDPDATLSVVVVQQPSASEDT